LTPQENRICDLPKLMGRLKCCGTRMRDLRLSSEEPCRGGNRALKRTRQHLLCAAVKRKHAFSAGRKSQAARRQNS